MKIENNPEIWTSIWNSNANSSIETIKANIEKTKGTEEWKYYNSVIKSTYGGWKNINAIEIGSGAGWHSLVAASEGASVTLIDYSESALKLAEERFEMLNLEGCFILGDAFEQKDLYRNGYNLSWSFGTIEHFKGDLRQTFFQLHFDYIIINGITIMSSPYKYALNYRLWMYYAQKYKEWEFGLERPYSKSELLNRLKTSENKFLKILFIEGRPCFYKLLNVLKTHSKWRHKIYKLLVRVIHKLKIRIRPFYFRNIILVAVKTCN